MANKPWEEKIKRVIMALIVSIKEAILAKKGPFSPTASRRLKKAAAYTSFLKNPNHNHIVWKEIQENYRHSIFSWNQFQVNWKRQKLSFMTISKAENLPISKYKAPKTVKMAILGP